MAGVVIQGRAIAGVIFHGSGMTIAEAGVETGSSRAEVEDGYGGCFVGRFWGFWCCERSRNDNSLFEVLDHRDISGIRLTVSTDDGHGLVDGFDGVRCWIKQGVSFVATYLLEEYLIADSEFVLLSSAASVSLLL